MKLKNVVQIAVLGVIGFVLAMGIGMLTGLLGVVSLYVSAGSSWHARCKNEVHRFSFG